MKKSRPQRPPTKPQQPRPPPKGEGGGGNPKPNDLQKRLAAEEAKNKKLQLDNKKLRGGGGGGQANTKPQPVSAEAKSLQSKLAAFKNALASAPDDSDLKRLVKTTEEHFAVNRFPTGICKAITL